MTYGYCVYHELECEYDVPCVNCPHNTKKDVEWFKHLDDVERCHKEESEESE